MCLYLKSPYNKRKKLSLLNSMQERRKPRTHGTALALHAALRGFRRSCTRVPGVENGYGCLNSARSAALSAGNSVAKRCGCTKCASHATAKNSAGAVAP